MDSIRRSSEVMGGPILSEPIRQAVVPRPLARGIAPRERTPAAVLERLVRQTHSTQPVHAVSSTTAPNAMRYQANGTKLWLAM